MDQMKQYLATLRLWAREYDPALAASLVAAFFQMLVLMGVALGDWPARVDAVLGFLAVLTTVLAGGQIRKRVDAPVTVRRREEESRARGYAAGYRHGRSGSVRGDAL